MPWYFEGCLAEGPCDNITKSMLCSSYRITYYEKKKKMLYEVKMKL